MVWVYFSEKHIEELLQGLQEERNNLVAKLRNNSEQYSDNANMQHPNDDDIFVPRPQRRKPDKKKKERPLRFDYKVPANDLSSQEVKRLIHIYNVSETIKDTGYECISLNMRPNVPVCLYPDKVDVFVSMSLRKDGIWEPHIVKVRTCVLFAIFSRQCGTVLQGFNTQGVCRFFCSFFVSNVQRAAEVLSWWWVGFRTKVPFKPKSDVPVCVPLCQSNRNVKYLLVAETT